MFEVSDIVAYGVNGVCTVTEITTKRITCRKNESRTY